MQCKTKNLGHYFWVSTCSKCLRNFNDLLAHLNNALIWAHLLTLALNQIYNYTLRHVATWQKLATRISLLMTAMRRTTLLNMSKITGSMVVERWQYRNIKSCTQYMMLYSKQQKTLCLLGLGRFLICSKAHGSLSPKQQLKTRSIWKMLGPFATTSRLTPIHQVSPLYCRTPPAHRCPQRRQIRTTTTTTTRDRGDRYGPMEWAQWS